MARKKKYDKVVLENIELKPQVIGYSYQKKSNIGRVFFIFIAFLLVVYYINDISVWINDLIGKESPETITNLSGNNNNNSNQNGNEDNTVNEIIYNVYQNTLIINEKSMTLNNFNYSNNKLTFDVINNSNTKLDLSTKKYFIETYTKDKTLLERYKFDISTINENAKVSFSFDVKKDFYYLVLEEKTVDDYPIVDLENDNLGVAKITCTKDIENIIYTFKDNSLEKIEHTIIDNKTTEEDYYKRYAAYQAKVASYKDLSGISSSFNATLNGYTAQITIDLQKVNLSAISEKYYFGYKELPKVVKFEMQTYGFICK